MTHPPIVARLAAVDPPTDRRRIRRQAVALRATLRELGSAGTEANIVNLSPNGFMASCDAQVAVGSRVWLLLPGRQRANAVVRWAMGGYLGAEFAEPLDPLPAR